MITKKLTRTLNTVIPGCNPSFLTPMFLDEPAMGKKCPTLVSTVYLLTHPLKSIGNDYGFDDGEDRKAILLAQS